MWKHSLEKKKQEEILVNLYQSEICRLFECVGYMFMQKKEGGQKLST